MAYDLIFGKTKHDWSIGGSIVNRNPSSTTLEVDAATDVSNKAVEQLFADTRREIQANWDTTQRLTRAKRLPAVEAKNVATFVNKWLNFGLSKNGVFYPEDIESLTQYREANKRFTERLAVFTHVASTPLKKPLSLPPAAPVALPGDSTALATVPQPPSSSSFLSWLLGIALVGLGFVVGKRR